MQSSGQILPSTWTTIDGVPVVWADRSRGPLEAALSFRVGASDETLPTRGITHLVEHLALPAHGGQAFELNGMVDDLRTMFYVRGRPDEVVRFLTDLCHAVSEIPVDRLESERRILRTESAGAEESAYGLMRLRRFGARGHGLVACREWGLQWLDAQRVQAWTRERFTAANAVLWLTGEPPDGLTLPLPPGERILPTPALTAPRIGLPAYERWGTRGAALAAVAPRATALSVAWSVLEERLRHTLRFERGLAYSVAGSYEPLTADDAYLFLATDALAGNEADVRDIVVDELRRLAADGPSEAELEQVKGLRRRQDEDAVDEVQGWLDYQAFNELLGTRESYADLVQEREQLTADAVAAALDTAGRNLLLLVPYNLDASASGLPAIADPSAEANEGRRFRERTARPWSRSAKSAYVSDMSVGLVDGDGSLTLRFDEVVGYFVCSDGTRAVYGVHGAWLTLLPQSWADGDQLERALDEPLAHLRVELPDGAELPL